MTEHPITDLELVRLTAIRMTIDEAMGDPVWARLTPHERTTLVLGWLVCDPNGHVDPDDLTQAAESPTMVAVADQLLAEATERRAQL